MRQLPASRYRVAALLHPAIWAAHGSRQVRGWLRECRRAGLILPEPHEDWRPIVVAADHVVGDHGSVTAYAAAVGRRVLLAPARRRSTDSCRSAQALLAETAPLIDLDRPIRPQLDAVPQVDATAVAAALTSRPGRAATLIRRTMYRLLDLAEPGAHATVLPVPVPEMVSARSMRGADG